MCHIVFGDENEMIQHELTHHQDEHNAMEMHTDYNSE